MATPTSCFDDFDCLNGGTCESPFDFLQDEHRDSTETSKCTCRPGYMGLKCENPCPILCQNGGQCTARDDHAGLQIEYECKCERGYSGATCKIDNNAPPDGPQALKSNEPSAGLKPGEVSGIAFGILAALLLLLLAFRVCCRTNATLKVTQPAEEMDVEAAEACRGGGTSVPSTTAKLATAEDEEGEFVHPRAPIS